jgi:hypothetical protein
MPVLYNRYRGGQQLAFAHVNKCQVSIITPQSERAGTLQAIRRSPLELPTGTLIRRMLSSTFVNRQDGTSVKSTR